MRGHNILILSPATMIEALEEYLLKRSSVYAPRLKVSSVKETVEGFKVSVQEIEKKKEAA